MKNISAALAMARMLQPNGADASKTYPTGEPLSKAYSRTMIGNSFLERTLHYEGTSLATWLEDWAAFLYNGNSDDGHDVSQGGLGADKPLEYSIWDVLYFIEYMAYFETEEGYVGLSYLQGRV
jgi:hypothetical protein